MTPAPRCQAPPRADAITPSSGTPVHSGGRGVRIAEARALVLTAAAACKPPLAEAEALACLDSAWRYEAPEKNEDIARLAKLTPWEYEQQRKIEAGLLGVRESELDEFVAAARPVVDAANTIPCPIPDVEPAALRQDGATLLDAIAARFRRYVIMPPHAAETLALWVLFT